tara:strand:+ start:1930 stop:2535 length:606 start_codon:yes stop_codon:yes gene_type:complete
MIKFPIKLFFYTILPSLIIYILVLFVSNSFNIKPELVLRDLAQTCGYPIGVGMISNIGILLWSASAAICLYLSLSFGINQQIYKLLFLGGFFSSVLCIDDFFLLHDRYIGPDFLNLTYLSMTLLLLIKFWKLLVQIGIFNLIISILFLGLSVLFDGIIQQFFKESYEITQIFEEGFKFLGIACWLNFWSKASYYALKLKTT